MPAEADARQFEGVEATQHALWTESKAFREFSSVEGLDAPLRAANTNEIGEVVSGATEGLAAVWDTLETGPEGLNFVNETVSEIGAGFKTLGAVLSIFGDDGPPRPATKEIGENMAAATAAERRARIVRMLTDRDYALSEKTADREEGERQVQREEEYQRTRQRY